MVNEAVETPEEPQAAGPEGPAARLLLPAPPLLRVPGLLTSFSSFLEPYCTVPLRKVVGLKKMLTSILLFFQPSKGRTRVYIRN